MCNLNILIRKSERVNKRITPFLMATTSASFRGNNDGEGFYFNKLVKGLNKIDAYKYRQELNKTRVILTHQRFSTSGKTNRYTQPFENMDFVFMHNGVMSDFVDGDKSDTYICFKEFQKEFNCTDTTLKRTTRIKQTIKKLFKQREGKWSIVVYDKIGDRIYYFKEETAKINCWKNHDFIYMSTSSNNEVFLDMLNVEFKELELEDYTIYSINPNNLKITKQGKIKKKMWDYVFDKEGIMRDSSSWNKEEEEEEIKYWNKSFGIEPDFKARDSKITNYLKEEREDYDKKLGLAKIMKQDDMIAEVETAGKCNSCKNKTHYWDMEGADFICQDCFFGGWQYV